MLRRHTPETFWARVKKSEGCWEFDGCLWKGYGQITYQGRLWQTHRLAYTLAIGPIPDGLDVLHRCDNRACCRPDHFFLGTQADNNRDMFAKGRNRNVYGSRHYLATLTESQVKQIRERYCAGEPALALAKEYGVTANNVRVICSGRSWLYADGPIATRAIAKGHNQGEARHNAFLTADIVRTIRDRHAQGESIASLKRAFRLHPEHVYKIVHRKIWKHVA